MLVQIGETCWIKAKKINEVKLYQKGKAGVWVISVPRYGDARIRIR